MKTSNTTSSNSNSPSQAQNLALVVSHQSKLNGGTSQISTKKYQCKMCPQVSEPFWNLKLYLFLFWDQVAIFNTKNIY